MTAAGRASSALQHCNIAAAGPLALAASWIWGICSSRARHIVVRAGSGQGLSGNRCLCLDQDTVGCAIEGADIGLDETGEVLRTG